MRANRIYRLIAAREGREPAFLADRERRDRIEVVSIDDSEVVFFWDLPAEPAARLIRELRADLVSLEAEEFFDKWLGTDSEVDG
jgi:hypothetical protein